MDLFSRYELGNIKLSNRTVMAPMTRCRAIEGNIPNPLAITYYVQRSQAGLIITEGSQVSPQGVGYIPGHGRREPFFGGLLLGAYGSGKLIFTGKVGSGFSM